MAFVESITLKGREKSADIIVSGMSSSDLAERRSVDEPRLLNSPIKVSQ